jgi:hypothetical protein
MFVVTTLVVDGWDFWAQKRLKSLLRTPNPEFLDTLSARSFRILLVYSVARSTAPGADAAHADDGFSLGALGAGLSLARIF